MEQAAEVGDVQHAVFDGHAAERAVHGFFEVDLVVAVEVDLAVVPDGRRVRIGPGEIAFLRFTTACSRLWRNRFLRVGGVEGQLGAHVAALGGVDAPQVAGAFAVFGIFAHRHVDEAVVE